MTELAAAEEYLKGKREGAPCTIRYVYEETYNYLIPILEKIHEDKINESNRESYIEYHPYEI